MFRLTRTVAGLLLAFVGASAFGQGYPNVGRVATEKEIAAWDIDVRPDFKGLPKGSGTVAKGMQVWDGKCASCHGAFGESNEVFTPIVGGTTAADVKSGRVAALSNNSQPQRTTMMKLATVSTLWDYINRAMPWTAPKTLTTEEVYAVTAYILNMAEVVPDNFTLSDQNIAEVQQRMPNRKGMSAAHGMWTAKGKPDVRSVACMKDCGKGSKIRSELPVEARTVHGSLAAQNRTFGAVRGIDATLPASGKTVPPAADRSAGADVPVGAASVRKDGAALAKANACMACHGLNNKIVGPAFSDVATRYKGNTAAQQILTGKIRNGSTSAWGPVPMPAQSHLNDEDIATMAGWILGAAK